VVLGRPGATLRRPQLARGLFLSENTRPDQPAPAVIFV
jgi:hypothetical protein